MSDLRYFLEKNLHQLYGHRISQVGGVNIPLFDSQEKLSSDDIDNLLGCVQIWCRESTKFSGSSVRIILQEHRGQKVSDTGHLSLYNDIKLYNGIMSCVILFSWNLREIPGEASSAFCLSHSSVNCIIP